MINDIELFESSQDPQDEVRADEQEQEVADDTTAIPYGVEFKLNPGIKKVWAIHLEITALVVLAIVCALNTFFPESIFTISTMTINYVIVGLLALWILIFGVIGTKLEYNFSSYTIEEDALVIKKGAFVRKTTLIPYTRIQHTGHDQGVIMNHYGLIQLNIATASGLFTLDGLEAWKADELAHLIARAVQNAREDM